MPLGLTIVVLGTLAVTVLASMGAAALWSGVHGRLVDRHARCRRCGFDLCGHTPRPVVCPECGGDLCALHSVRVGRRQAQWPVVAAGGALLLAGLAPVAWAAWPRTLAATPPPALALTPQPAVANLGARPRRASPPVVATSQSVMEPDDAVALMPRTSDEILLLVGRACAIDSSLLPLLDDAAGTDDDTPVFIIARTGRDRLFPPANDDRPASLLTRSVGSPPRAVAQAGDVTHAARSSGPAHD